MAKPVYFADLFAAAVVGANAASTTLVGTVGTAIPAGKIVILGFGGDNSTAVAGDSADIAITDSVGGNTWARAKERSPGVAANAGATGGVYWCQLATALTVGATITATFSSRAAKVMSGTAWTLGAGSTFAVFATAGGSGVGVPAVPGASGLVNGDDYLAVALLAYESNATTGTISTIQGSATDLVDGVCHATTGGGATANIGLAIAYRPLTSNSTTISAGSGIPGSVDYAGVMVVFKETASGNQTVSPGVGAVTMVGFEPTIASSDNQSILPGAGDVTMAGFAPTITSGSGADQNILPGTGDVAIAGFAPTIVSSDVQIVLPGSGAITVAGFAPSIVSSDNQLVQPDVGAITTIGFAPGITSSDNQFILPDSGAILFQGFEPTITSSSSSSGDQSIAPFTGEIFITGFAPTIDSGGVIAPPPDLGSYVIGGGGGTRVSAARRRTWERAIARALRAQQVQLVVAAEREEEPAPTVLTIERAIRRLNIPAPLKRQLVRELREPRTLPFLRGIATFAGLETSAALGEIRPEYGGTAALMPMMTEADLGAIVGDGVQNPSDEELIALLFK